MAKIAPSVLAADFARLGEDIADAERAGAELFHLDIMDGHFVPNLSYGPGIVSTINRLTGLFLDVHLMLTEPERYFEPFIEAGADNITFHLEVHPEPGPFARELHERGIKAGLSINPDMPVERALPHLQHFDYLLIMSVFPGFGGQSFIPNAMEKVSAARRYIDVNRLGTKIEVDGGVNEQNAWELKARGADILVMGTAFFRHPDRANLITRVKEPIPLR